jgi:hypothetical protein
VYCCFKLACDVTDFEAYSVFSPSTLWLFLQIMSKGEVSALNSMYCKTVSMYMLYFTWQVSMAPEG